MKKLLLGIAVMFASVGLFAQPAQKSKDHQKKHHGKHHKHHHRKGMALQQLNLTEDQKAQMTASRADFKSQMKAASSDQSQTVKQLQDKRTSIAKAQKAKFESILTSDQKNKLAQMKTDAKQKHQEGMAKHLDKMKTTLGLSDAQVATLKQDQTSIQGKMKAIHENDKLDKTAKKEQMKALRGEMKSNFDKVLSSEQKDKMKTMMEEKKSKMGGRKQHSIDKQYVK